MTNVHVNPMLPYLRRLATPKKDRACSDAELLQQFVQKRDEAAFTRLLERHGPMVLGVCRRVLNDAHRAEDAFQATFLVLAKKASAVGQPERLGSWLHGVAYRTALKARGLQPSEQGLPIDLLDGHSREPIQELARRELQLVLDEEIQRLPAKYRVPVVLCYLEGQTYQEAARRLGCPAGTVSGRLARAREHLRGRLMRRGFTFSAGVLATLLGPQTLSAKMPASLLTGTVHAVVTGTTVGVSQQAIVLTQGVLQAMLWTKIKIAVTLLVVLTCAGFTAGFSTFAGDTFQIGKQRQKATPGAQKKPKVTKIKSKVDGTENGEFKAYDKNKKTITVLVHRPARLQIEQPKGGEALAFYMGYFITGPGQEVHYPLSNNVRVHIDSTRSDATKLAAKMPVDLVIKKGKVTQITVTGPLLKRVVTSINAGKNTVVLASRHPDEHGRFPKRHQVAANAKVTIDGKPSRLQDLKPGMRVNARQSVLKPILLSLRAEGPRIDAIINRIDIRKRTLTVTLVEPALYLGALQLALQASIRINDKAARLADMKPGMRVSLRMGAETHRSLVIGIDAKKGNE